MGFKADASFLRFVSMGAAGTRRIIEILQDRGFTPIELERYATSNKIWATKIKRLRLPDLLCVKTGLRVEVKTKSSLVVKMSDTPGNADRVWHAGLRDEDVIAFIAANGAAGELCIAEDANFFQVAALMASEEHSRLGPPKSVGEGSERDREWPTYVPPVSGRVLGVFTGGFLDQTPTHLRLELTRAEGENKRQTYALRDKRPYVKAGDKFVGLSSIIAGVLPQKCDLDSYLTHSYDPLTELEAPSVVDRFAALKALAHRPDILKKVGRKALLDLLSEHIDGETDARVRLEAVATASALGSRSAQTLLRAVVEDASSPQLQMEAVFILSEQYSGVSADVSRDTLRAVLEDPSTPSELRQAAIWGLGFAGHRRFQDILPYLDDEDENVAMHAIAAFGVDVPQSVIGDLVVRLDERAPRIAAASSEVLRLIATDEVITQLVSACKNSYQRVWALATMGRLSPNDVRAIVSDQEILVELAPLMRVFSSENWLAIGDRPDSLAFLLQQRL